MQRKILLFLALAALMARKSARKDLNGITNYVARTEGTLVRISLIPLQSPLPSRSVSSSSEDSLGGWMALPVAPVGMLSRQHSLSDGDRLDLVGATPETTGRTST